jgi:hypothetical protein
LTSNPAAQISRLSTATTNLVICSDSTNSWHGTHVYTDEDEKKRVEEEKKRIKEQIAKTGTRISRLA